MNISDKRPKSNITPFEQDVAKWYTDLVLKSELISYGAVKGTLYFRPYGYAIWKKIEKIFNERFEELGIQEVKFPLLFPEGFLKKEQHHIIGFSPEVLKVTEAGLKTLNEKLIIRPTSELLFADYLKKTLLSYSELPILLNQWVSVLRWENNTKPFLRNVEFLWQEGHTTHESSVEAMAFSLKIIDIYQDVINNYFMIPVLKGQKTELEKFAGAEVTFAIDTILKDGQGLQSATSHYLADNFTKGFNIKIRGRDNQLFTPFQTSWGISTRILGALVMIHSDNYGLILPAQLAPYQIVIISIFNNEDDKKIMQFSEKINQKLRKDFRVYFDQSDKGKGYKLREWEIKGVPIILEIGAKEAAEEKLIVRIRANNKKSLLSAKGINPEKITKLLALHDQELWKNANNILKAKIKVVDSLAELFENLKNGYVCKGYWSEDSTLEEEIKQEYGATIRILEKASSPKLAINKKQESNTIAYFARAY